MDAEKLCGNCANLRKGGSNTTDLRTCKLTQISRSTSDKGCKKHKFEDKELPNE